MTEKVERRESIMERLSLIPVRAAILLALVGFLHVGLIHYAATGEPWLFAGTAITNGVAITLYAVFGPDVW